MNLSTSLPPFLTKNSLIGITCPAGYVAPERVAYAAELLTEWGFQVKIGNTVGMEHFYFSGNDEARLTDLQTMLDDERMDAILMGRGGYGVSRIIDRLDFTSFLKKPKWICGFSDITVLHSHLHAQYQMPTLHCAMGAAFTPAAKDSEPLKSILSALTGEQISYQTPPAAFNRKGIAEGILTGGNLAILAHLTGSVSEVNTDGKILFIEDIGEHLYNIDRMMMQLKRAGKLNHLKALVVGSFTDLQDTERPFGQAIDALIFDKVSEYNYPVCFNFPAGHQEENFALRLGMMHLLEVTEAGGILDGSLGATTGNLR